MYLEILSPHNGEPVKIRTADIGRSVRDSQGRIFYVLQTSDGQNHYASLTRQGSPQAEQQYQALVSKHAHILDTGKQASAKQIHDATGPGRPWTEKITRWTIRLLLLLTLLATIAWLLTSGPFKDAPWNPLNR